MKDVAREPDFAYSYEDLGTLYAQLNQTEKAERAYRHAIELDQTLVNSYVGLGKLYRHAGRDREALEMLDHAVALAPNAPAYITRAPRCWHGWVNLRTLIRNSILPRGC